MSGPVPSPSMKGRMGWEGTSRRPSGRAWMRSPGGTEMVEYGGTRGLSVLRPPVEGLDDAGKSDGEGRLLGGPEDRLVVADDLHQETAIVRVHGEHLQDDAVDHWDTSSSEPRAPGSAGDARASSARRRENQIR